MSSFLSIDLGLSPKSILVIDRSPLLAEVLSHELEALHVFECSFISRGANIVEEVSVRKPDAVVIDPIDISVFGVTDLSKLGLDLRNAHPPINILGYSFKMNSTLVSATLDAGFNGCISRDVDFNHLKLALVAILEGGLYFDQCAGPHLRPAVAETYDTDGLSEREKEVLVGFARGLSSKQIAYDLNISNKTVDTYKARASQKLDLHDRAQLVRYVFEKGWIV